MKKCEIFHDLHTFKILTFRVLGFVSNRIIKASGLVYPGLHCKYKNGEI